MTDDLVARLRGFATDANGWAKVSADARPYLHDAADRIEQDAVTIARLEGEVASWRMASTEAEKEVAAVRAQRASAEAEVARLMGERERLALSICGGEDAPGYANAQPVEALEKVARDNAASAMWQIDRTMKAEAKVAALVEALGKALEGLNWAKAYLSTVGIKSTAVNEADAAVYAAIAAAKEGA